MIKVLLVDDHELVRTGVKSILERAMDIEVVAEASNGEEAVELSKKTDANVVLMDVSMPGIGYRGDPTHPQGQSRAECDRPDRP
jgi:two-component system invasion response regulator UvrY